MCQQTGVSPHIILKTKNISIMLNYSKLIENQPTVYTSFTNSLGQVIDLVEHPFKGDEAPIIAVCRDLKLAAYTDFFDTDDMLADHKEYEPNFAENEQGAWVFCHGDHLIL